MEQKYDHVHGGQEPSPNGSEVKGEARHITSRPFTSWYLSSMFDEEDRDERL